MKVSLISITPAEAIIKATSMPYKSEESLTVVENVWKSGHRSVARHGMASFAVEGVSQSLLAQLSRHPHINLTVESSRYCDMSDKQYAIPPFVKVEDIGEYVEDIATLKKIYSKWVGREGYTKKCKQELAKMFIGKGSQLDLVVSGNLQALYEFLQLRLCSRAEWEIQQMAVLMSDILRKEAPYIFKKVNPKCTELGYCPEHQSCGRFKVKEVK